MVNVIYCLYCTLDGEDDIYIGSTSNLLKRYKIHMSKCKNLNITYDIYKKMRETGAEHWKARILEYCDGMSVKKLRKREQEYINMMVPKLNTIAAYCTKRDYYIKNRDEILEKTKIYRNANKEKIRKYKCQKIQCSCGKKITRTHKARHEKTTYHKKNTK